MTRKTIENPTVDDLREGDVVTIARGEKGEPGYTEQTRLVRDGDPRIEVCHLDTIRDCVDCGYRITEVRREVPDLPDLPAHAGALAFTNTGLAISDGVQPVYWTIPKQGGEVDTDELVVPVAATPVPSKELAELLAETRNGSNVDIAAAVFNFASACRREWERAGIPEPEVES